ncbi:DUF317 domain-containing protein [Kitasatospora sp. NPDC058190]|uniref:DUF317 domain-containing protein n=1 Tax=Kitasatospora sp. NPDC058190 TaxID=3346371 RepID=UPI0036DC43CF
MSSGPDGRPTVGAEQGWGTLWKIAVTPDASAVPRWGANFSADTPTEIVKSVTTELAHMYRANDATWLDERPAGPLEWIAPYAAAGWTPQGVDRGRLTLRSPDGLASIAYRRAGLLHADESEQAGQDGRFTIGTVKSAGWYGRFSGGTPTRILQAASTAMLDATPVVRYRDALDYYAKQTATITDHPAHPQPPGHSAERSSASLDLRTNPEQASGRVVERRVGLQHACFQASLKQHGSRWTTGDRNAPKGITMTYTITHTPTGHTVAIVPRQTRAHPSAEARVHRSGGQQRGSHATATSRALRRGDHICQSPSASATVWFGRNLLVQRMVTGPGAAHLDAVVLASLGPARSGPGGGRSGRRRP